MDSGNGGGRAAPDAEQEEGGEDQQLLSSSGEAHRIDLGAAPAKGFLHPTAPVARVFRALIWDRGLACIIASSLLFAAAAALVKPLATVPVFQIVLVRSALSLCLTAAVAAAQGLSPRALAGRRANLPALVTRGVVGSSAMTAFYLGLPRLPLSDSIAILYSNPALTALGARVLLGERFGALTAAGCAASMVGVLFVARPAALFGEAHPGGGGSFVGVPGQRAAGIAYAVLSAVLASGAMLAIRVVGKKEAAITVAFHFHTAACAASAVGLAAGWPEPPRWALPRAAWAALAGIAGCSFAANLLLSRGFQTESAARASAASYSQVLWAHALGVLLFGEELSWAGAAGAACIAAGVLAVSADGPRGGSGGGAPAPQRGAEVQLGGVLDRKGGGPPPPGDPDGVVVV